MMSEITIRLIVEGNNINNNQQQDDEEKSGNLSDMIKIYLDEYKNIREYTAHEGLLTDQRLRLTVAFNVFLIGLFYFLINKEFVENLYDLLYSVNGSAFFLEDRKNSLLDPKKYAYAKNVQILLMIFTCIVGSFISGIAYRSINAARDAIKRLDELCKERKNFYENYLASLANNRHPYAIKFAVLPPIAGVGDEAIVKRGRGLSICLPLAFLVFWLSVAAFLIFSSAQGGMIVTNP